MPAVRQKLHLSSCANFRGQLSILLQKSRSGGVRANSCNIRLWTDDSLNQKCAWIAKFGILFLTQMPKIFLQYRRVSAVRRSALIRPVLGNKRTLLGHRRYVAFDSQPTHWRRQARQLGRLPSGEYSPFDCEDVRHSPGTPLRDWLPRSQKRNPSRPWRPVSERPLGVHSRRNRPEAEQKCSSSKISFNHASYRAITAEPSVRARYCPRAEMRQTPDMFLS